jgi:hypothetical protein
MGGGEELGVTWQPLCLFLTEWQIPDQNNQNTKVDRSVLFRKRSPNEVQYHTSRYNPHVRRARRNTGVNPGQGQRLRCPNGRSWRELMRSPDCVKPTWGEQCLRIALSNVKFDAEMSANLFSDRNKKFQNILNGQRVIILMFCTEKRAHFK